MTTPLRADEARVTAELDQLRARLLEVTDRLEIRELFDRYVVALDTVCERGYGDDWFRSVFTEDAQFVFPIGTHRGVRGFAAFQREARSWWEGTHHVSANHLVELDGDRATLRAHQLATHVHGPGGPEEHFRVGGHSEVRAVRTAAGWRFHRLVFRIAWTSGEPLESMRGVDF
ncbi:nuclear transport factor 2 family protein [Streptomyces filamentosus]|uniref:nuclear transport factor 2 family protein n=1 Tax=Streptomyces filamentosus TaxID=67294 RepID=UPI0033EC5637